MMMDTKVSNITGIDPKLWQIMKDCVRADYDMLHFLDSMSPNQLESKTWLSNALGLLLNSRKNLHVQLYGGWFGYPLINILKQNLDISFVENIDMNEKALYVFRQFAFEESFRFSELHADVKTPSKKDWDIDIVINTSSEHMHNLPEIIEHKNYRRIKDNTLKPPCLFAIQSNDMFHIADHTHCSRHEDELEERCQLTKVLYKGTKKMSNGYNRFMVIGHV